MDELEKNAIGVFVNPFYAVNFAQHVFKQHENLGSKEDWVAANAHTMKDMGVSNWLGEFLDFISQSRSQYDGHDIVNPTIVVNISSHLSGKHEPLISRKQWTQVNGKLIDDTSPETWLWQLLDVLETGALH